MKRVYALLTTLVFAAVAIVNAGAQTIRVTGQILAYQAGYVFFTTGDGFHVSPTVTIADAKTGGATQLRPGPRMFARATFDATGTIVELDLSTSQLPPEGDFSMVQRFAIALSTPVPNPDLATPAPGQSAALTTGNGRLVVVVFEAQVPPSTPIDALVYMTTDAAAWNPQAIPMQRVDALHFRVVERLAVGTVLHYLYTRGSFASEERSSGGLTVKPRIASILNVDSQVYRSIIYRWADDNGAAQLLQPNTFPTPFNPAPFPNLPPGIHTPHP